MNATQTSNTTATPSGAFVQFLAGWQMYAERLPLTRTTNVEQMRGWLSAQQGHRAAHDAAADAETFQYLCGRIG